ncbi:MAG: HPF/RaiA family ribosome-associated protein [Planctomycetota bacterium]
MIQERPIQIHFHGVPHTAALEGEILSLAGQLDRFSDRIHKCTIEIAREASRHQVGNRFRVRIQLHLPGCELVVGHHPPKATHTDLSVALHDAFKAMERQLEEHMHVKQRFVKTHFQPDVRGRVARVFPEQDYGFIETFDGREVYFHRNSVVHAAIEELAIGAEVRIVEEDGEQGPQASTVVPKSAAE